MKVFEMETRESVRECEETVHTSKVVNDTVILEKRSAIRARILRQFLTPKAAGKKVMGGALLRLRSCSGRRAWRATRSITRSSGMELPRRATGLTG